MMEMVVFALVIVAAQVMAGLIAMVISLKLMLNKKFNQIQLLTNILSRTWESCFNLSH